MNQFNKEILDALSSDSKTSLKDVFRNQLEQTVNTLLQEELSAVLGYQPYERNDSSSHGDNARNGDRSSEPSILNLDQSILRFRAIVRINFVTLYSNHIHGGQILWNR